MSFAQSLREPFQLLDRRLPDRVPPLAGKPLWVLRLLWLLAFALAVVGPLGGIYLRLSEPPDNSQLLLGSRAGIAVSLSDATQVRFAVGPFSREAGIGEGYDVIAIRGVPLPQEMPMTVDELAEHADDPAYTAITNLLFGTEEASVPLTIRAPDGSTRDVNIKAGEHHIDAEARQIGIPPALLSLLDLSHVLFYPLLLWVALVLHMRNPTQPVPTLLSFAILLMVGSELPSSSFLLEIGVPRGALIALYDFGNIALIAAVLLFPDGRLTPRRVLIPLFLLPVLIFLEGQLYQSVFLLALIVAVTVFVKRLRGATGATKQQLKFLFVGLAGYPVFRSLSYLFDLIKLEASSSSGVLLLEFAAGVMLALSIVALFFVLFSALRRHRLYDAEELFSRSAMVAALTLTITAFFAITSTVLQSASESLLAQNAGAWPSIIAAAAAVLLIKPAQRRIHDWAERQFQKGLFELRTELPKRMDDLRETASPSALLEDALRRIVAALRSTGAAAIVNDRVAAKVCVSAKDVRQWLRQAQLQDGAQLHCDRGDDLFPLRLPLRGSSDGSPRVGWILLGPRPDGSIYSRDEQQALLDIEESIARAVEVARERQQAVAADRRWKARQEKRFQELEDRIDQLSDVLIGSQSRKAQG